MVSSVQPSLNGSPLRGGGSETEVRCNLRSRTGQKLQVGTHSLEEFGSFLFCFCCGGYLKSRVSNLNSIHKTYSGYRKSRDDGSHETKIQ